MDIATAKLMDTGKIENIYKELNEIFINSLSFGNANNEGVRNLFKVKLQNEFPNYQIKCDNENNSPLVVNSNTLIARLAVKGIRDEWRYCVLVFGKEEDVKQIQQELNL